MKKTTFFLFSFLIGISIFGQTRYHRLKKLGNDLPTATSNFCQSITLNQLKLNITNISSKLSVGTTLLIDINDAYVDGYYKVEYSQDNSNQDADETVAYSAITIITFNCPTPAPDLRANFLSINTNSVNIGGSTTATYSVTNIGDAVSNSSQFKFYLSENDNVLSTDDVLLKTLNFGTLIINGIRFSSTSLTIPSNANAGSYYFIMKVIDSEDPNSNNDVASSTAFNVTLTSTDTDGDGVPNSSDNCPNVAGPASNNGCPVYADLIIDSNASTAKSSGAPGVTQSLSSNAFHALYLGESLQILLFVKNVGQANSSSMKVGFYVTQGSSFSNATLLKEVNYNGIINPNQSQSMSTEIFGSSIAGYANSNGWAYIHIRVDKSNDVDEGTTGGEDNNIYSSIPVVTYYTPR